MKSTYFAVLQCTVLVILCFVSPSQSAINSFMDMLRRRRKLFPFARTNYHVPQYNRQEADVVYKIVPYFPPVEMMDAHFPGHQPQQTVTVAAYVPPPRLPPPPPAGIVTIGESMPTNYSVRFGERQILAIKNILPEIRLDYEAPPFMSLGYGSNPVPVPVATVPPKERFQGLQVLDTYAIVGPNMTIPMDLKANKPMDTPLGDMRSGSINSGVSSLIDLYNMLRKDAEERPPKKSPQEPQNLWEMRMDRPLLLFQTQSWSRPKANSSNSGRDFEFGDVNFKFGDIMLDFQKLKEQVKTHQTPWTTQLLTDEQITLESFKDVFSYAKMMHNKAHAEKEKQAAQLFYDHRHVMMRAGTGVGPLVRDEPLLSQRASAVTRSRGFGIV